MKFTRREAAHAAAAIAASSLALLAAGGAMAQVWPARPITIVVSYPAGGDTDAVARIYAEKLSLRVGQPVLVDNRPGASGMIGNAWVAKAAPDGYTLLFTPSTFPIAQHVLKAGPGVAHDVVKDFTPIVKTGNIPLLLVTAPSTGIKNVAQLVADARAGKALSYGTPGAGSPMHIAGELFNKDAGTQIAHAPYRGVAPVVNDALGGHVGVGWITPGAVAGHIASGKLVALAVAERQRTKLMPGVPTLWLQGRGCQRLDGPAGPQGHAGGTGAGPEPPLQRSAEDARRAGPHGCARHRADRRRALGAGAADRGRRPALRQAGEGIRHSRRMSWNKETSTC